MLLVITDLQDSNTHIFYLTVTEASLRYII